MSEGGRAGSLAYRVSTRHLKQILLGERLSISVVRLLSAAVADEQEARRRDPSLLEAYDWGPQGIPKGTPFEWPEPHEQEDA